MTQTVRAGIIGCGNISAAYFKASRMFPILEIAACADLDRARAEASAAEYGIGRAYSVEEMLADPQIDIVLNLTIPLAHYEISLAALNAGKHVYTEKPLTVTRDQGKHLLETASAKGLRVGCAPDTFLGAGLQTCRKVIDDGVIGEPIGAAGFMQSHGPENWHPSPEFVYQKGGGPMFDMGPYYLTAYVSLIGPFLRLSGSARVTFPERMITSQPKYGTMMTVETPTHIAAVIDFAGGAVGTLVTSFDVWASTLPNIEIYGTEGSMLVPDPNSFAGVVRVKRMDEDDWRDVPLVEGVTVNGRGVGLADMAEAIVQGRPHRASGEMAYHVLEAMHGFHDASDSASYYKMQSSCPRPAALSPNQLATLQQTR